MNFIRSEKPRSLAVNDGVWRCNCCWWSRWAPTEHCHATGKLTEMKNLLRIKGVHLLSLCFQHPHRRVTFSTANPVQDLQDASQHSYYDSGLEESETPSSKSSSGPRIGPLTLPEDHYERTTPDGSIGETEHPENGTVSMSWGRTPTPGWASKYGRIRGWHQSWLLQCLLAPHQQVPCQTPLMTPIHKCAN